jgi:hypothetical protein
MAFTASTAYGSTTNQDFWHTKRGTIECFAASDVIAGAAVTFGVASTTSSSFSPIANPPGFFVRMCASSSDEPVGFARDYAVAGKPVSVIDIGNIVRETVQGSVNLGAYVGVISASPVTNPISNVSNLTPNLGAVTGASYSNIVIYGVSSTSTFTPVWAVGRAMDIGNPGQGVAVRVNPLLLSGLAAG